MKNESLSPEILVLKIALNQGNKEVFRCES